MRIKNLILGDIRFQFKYGFYFVYAVFTILYLCLLYFIPKEWSKSIRTILIFSDPAAMGLFFMGAIVLLEKSQRVLNSIAVSPVKVWEYILSKVISIGIISVIVSFLLTLPFELRHLALLITGTFLGSVIFSLLGLIAAARVTSLNQFLLATIPLELAGIVPPILYLFGFRKTFMLFHPGCIIIRFLEGNAGSLPVLLVILSGWMAFLFFITYQVIKRMFRETGGVKL